MACLLLTLVGSLVVVVVDVTAENIYTTQSRPGSADDIQSLAVSLQEAVERLTLETRTALQELKNRQDATIAAIDRLRSEQQRNMERLDALHRTLRGEQTQLMERFQEQYGFAPVPTSLPTTPLPVVVPQDCKDRELEGNVKEGVYQVTIGSEVIDVFCSGGFVTIQRRFDGSLRFDKTLSEYEQGFGNVTGEHWLGLRYQHLLTNGKHCTFRALIDVDTETEYNQYNCRDRLADCDGQTKEITADNFRVSSAADQYRVNMTFNTTDFLSPLTTREMSMLSGQPFTAKDSQNNIQRSCATTGVVGGGFWFNDCRPGYPNSVIFSEDPVHCSSSNSVCGYWGSYFFKGSVLQFSC